MQAREHRGTTETIEPPSQGREQGKDIVNHPESDFLLLRQQTERPYLDASTGATRADDRPMHGNSISFKGDAKEHTFIKGHVVVPTGAGNDSCFVMPCI